MAIINCPECQKEISNTATTCIHCGYKLKLVSNKMKKVIITTCIIIIVIVLGIVTYKINQNNQKEKVQTEYYDNKMNDLKSKFDEAKENFDSTFDQKYVDEMKQLTEEMKELSGY